MMKKSTKGSENIKKPLKIQIDELQAEFSKPHTKEEYELLHKKHKRLLAMDFFKGIALPLIALLFSIMSLIVQLLLR